MWSIEECILHFIIAAVHTFILRIAQKSYKKSCDDQKIPIYNYKLHKYLQHHPYLVLYTIRLVQHLVCT